MTTVADVTNRLSDDAMYGESVFRSVVFSYNGFLQKLAEAGAEEYRAGTTAKVELQVDLGDAEVYIEGQNLPVPLEETIQLASFDFKFFRAVIRESGHEQMARGPNDEGTRIARINNKIDNAYDRIRYLMATTWDDAATYGIQGIISAGTYAYGSGTSINRNIYTKTKSYELNAGGQISTSLANQVHFRSQDDPYGAEVEFYLAPALQCQRYAELGSGKMVVPADSGNLDLVKTDLTIGGRPVYMLPNLTSSVILGLSGVRAGNWKLIWHEANPGRFRILDLGADNSDTPLNLQISTACCILCDQPQKQVKILGLT